MKIIILSLSLSAMLSGCSVVKQRVDPEETTIITSNSNQRVSVFKKSVYCPDAPPETGKEITSNVSIPIRDAAGNSVSGTGSYNTELINLSNRNQTANLIVYSMNYLCVLRMNEFIDDKQVSDKFDTIIQAAVSMAQAQKTQAEAQLKQAQSNLTDSEAHFNQVNHQIGNNK